MQYILFVSCVFVSYILSFSIFTMHSFLLTPKTWLEFLHCCTFPKSFCSPHLCLQKITCTENSLENTMNIHSSLLNINFCFSVSVCSALRCFTVKMRPPSSDQLQFKCRRWCTKIHFTLLPNHDYRQVATGRWILYFLRELTRRDGEDRWRVGHVHVCFLLLLCLAKVQSSTWVHKSTRQTWKEYKMKYFLYTFFVVVVALCWLCQRTWR